MDDVELAITAAWARLGPGIKADAKEFTRRLARRHKTLFGRPPRAWCLAVRASDTRMGNEYAVTSGRSERERHFVTLDAASVKALCWPVRIEPPGETLRDVAKKLGVSPRGLTVARLNDVFRVRYVRGLGGWWGKPVPVLYTDRLLDPAMQTFRIPDRLWSWTATYLPTRVPKRFKQTIERAAAYVPAVSRGVHGEAHVYPSHALPPPPVADEMAAYKWKDGVYLGYDWRRPGAKENYERHERRKAMERASRKRRRMEYPAPSQSAGSIQFRGWAWLCPQCGRTAKTLLFPLPPINLLTESSQFNRGMPFHVSERRLGAFAPSAKQFACGRCHRVRHVSPAEPSAWNHFVTYLSGGLLFGHEVEKPKGYAPRRQRKYRPQANRPAPRRELVRRRLIAGHTIHEIATELQVRVSAVHNHLRAMCRTEGVRDRDALMRKLCAKEHAAVR
jgi:hypothetical protein